MRDKLSELDLPYPGSNRGYDPLDIIEELMTGIVLGARHREHSGMLRTDAVVHQESAEVGYDREKKGRRSHHPLMAFCDELKMTVNAEVAIVPRPWIQGLIWADAGFYSDKILRHIETMGVKYIVKASRTTSMMARILNVRVRKEKCTKETNRTKQMNLFKDLDTPDKNDYMAFVTNDMESALHIHA